MIQAATPRNEVQVRFPDGLAFNGAMGTTAEQFINIAYPKHEDMIVGALIGGQLRELTQPIEHDAALTPITCADSDGMRIYKRSLSFLLIVAAAELFPDRSIKIEHSMPHGGYYCESTDGLPFSAEQIANLNAHMRKLVAENLPIVSQEGVPVEEAKAIFNAKGDTEKADLLDNRRRDHVKLYQLNNIRDYFHGFMVPSTGYLKVFDLIPYLNGFILNFPRRREPDKLQSFKKNAWLSQLFQGYGDWLKTIGVPNVATLNSMVTSGRILETILTAEAHHTRQLSEIADHIVDVDRPKPVKIVLISGPSSAGKTTFSKRLAVQLLARGIHPVAIGMDDYFVDREHTPRTPDGDFDFENLAAVNVPLFTQHMRELLEGKQIVMPHYDFHTGSSHPGNSLQLRSDQVLIIEGIHGLNPKLVEGIDPEMIHRIFISAFTQLNIDKHNRVPTTDTRKLRRIVRDYYNRGYSAADTIKRWPKVRAGEKDWIFPHQSNADDFFNSALVYELAAMKMLAEPILLQIEPNTPERVEANRLRAFLQWFEPITPEVLKLIPGDSLLLEFTGGSILEDFKPWVEA